MGQVGLPAQLLYTCIKLKHFEIGATTLIQEYPSSN